MPSRTHHLLRNHDTRLDGELSATHLKQILQAWSEEIDNQDVVETLLTKVVDLRDTGYKEDSINWISDETGVALTASAQDFVAAVLVS